MKKLKIAKFHKKYFLLSLPILIIIPLSSWLLYENFSVSNQQAPFILQSTTVKKVIDGDTFIDTKNITYRLFAINTWETTILQTNGKRVATTGKIHFWAQKAKQKLIELIDQKEINFLERGTDQYHRQLATVFINGLDIQKELVQIGLAEVKYISINPHDRFFTSDKKYLDEILKLEHLAKFQKLNMWS